MAVPRLLLLLLVSFFASTGSSSPPLANLQECRALLRLAGKLSLATNCNCTFTFPATQTAPNWKLCNATCFAKSPSPSPFVACAPLGFPVRELHLSGLALQGNISWVQDFKHLQLLDLSVNNLSGSIPSSLWSLAELTHINLSFNRFNGSFPDLDSAISSPMQALDLSHNSFAGHVSQNLCISLPNLTQLNVSSNNLTGFMNLSFCRRLEFLDASLNRLHGPLFDDLVAVNSLKSINLKQNYLLNGSIPHLSSFPHLVHLDISFNSFNGRLGFESNDLPSNLSTVNVSHNHLQVGLSTETIVRFGLPSFWPNKACEGCFAPPLALTAMAPSASASTPVSMPTPVSATVRHHEPYQKSIHAHSKLKQLDMIIGGVAGGVSATIIIATLCCLCFRKRDRKTIWPPHTRKRQQLPSKHCPELGPFCFESQFGSWIADVKDPSSVSVVIFQKPLLNLTFADLLLATKSFDREFEVGDVTDLAYACVVPGIVADNAKVTIKLIEQGHSLSNEVARAAFTKMGELKHENLVPLFGYCIVGEEKLLIYEHMEGGSLEDVLHAVPEGAPLLDSSAAVKAMAEDWCNIESWPDNNEASAVDCSSKPFLDWKARHNIAMSMARALAYLHNGYHQPIVHGAASSSCILLDMSAKKPKLANYGGAWGLPRQQAPGCVAPECRQSAQTAALQLPSALKCRESVQVVATYSAKCDVYAMGVVLLELATGKPAVGNYGANLSGATLVSWVRSVMKGKSSPERAVDPKLQASSHLPQLVEMMKVGYLCTADSPSKRPSMQQVVGLLKDLRQS